MRRFGAFVFIALALTAFFPTGCAFVRLQSPSANESENGRFTDREIKEDIRRYLSVLLGEKEPTLQDYYDFEGENTQEEDEMLFEIDHCDCMGWSPALHSAECMGFMKQRALNAAEAPSYYYRFLREVIGHRKGKLKIQRIIRVNEGKKEYQLVLVKASLAKLSLEFYHAGDAEAVAPLGLVHLSKINGEDVLDIVGKRDRNCD